MTAFASPGVTATQTARPVVMLSCDVSEGVEQMLCDGLRQAMTERLPDYLVQKVTAPIQTPTRPNDIAVGLQVLEQGQSHILARLDWCTGPCSTPHKGDPLRFSVMDTQLSPHLLHTFAHTLLRANPKIQLIP